MPSQQFEDLPPIQYMGEVLFSDWSPDYYGYQFVDKQQPASFSVIDDNAYLDNLSDSMLSMQPMQRFMFDPSPQSHGLLHANIPLQNQQHPKQFSQQWPSNDYHMHRNVSPDRTSISGTSSYASQSDIPSPQAHYTASHGSPVDFFQSSQLYHNFMHFNDVTYTSGSSINPKEIEYTCQEPEPTIGEADADVKQEAAVDSERTSIKSESVVGATYRGGSDSGIGNSVRDAESVQPVDLKDDSASDSEYSPTCRGGKRRRSAQHTIRAPSRRGAARKDSVADVSVQKKRGRKPRSTMKLNVDNQSQDEHRSFPCPLAAYNCSSTFSSKNEWKRHVNTQHIKLGFWRCSLCAPTTDPNDTSALYYNDFNRKDLFTQHLRRMHAAQGSGARHTKEHPVNEDNIQDYQTRCYLQLRCAPQQSICPSGGCEREFFGPTSWEERMDHVARHMEKDKTSGAGIFDVASWKVDTALQQYLIDEDLIVWKHGTWQMGDGKPQRVGGESSDDEC